MLYNRSSMLCVVELEHLLLFYFKPSVTFSAEVCWNG